MNISVFVAVAISASLVVHAGDDIRVLSTRGQAIAKYGGKEQQVKAGALLPPSTSITIGHGGYVALLSSKGGMRELRSPGVHKTDTMFSGKTRSSTMSRVAKYVYANAYEKEVTASETGTVYRTQSVAAVWPPNLITDSADVTLSWLPVRGYSGRYEVVIRNDDDSVLLVKTTSDTSLHADAGMLTRANRGTCVYWTVQLERDIATSSKPRCITVTSPDDARELAAQVQALKTECQNTSDRDGQVVCAILIGALYEEQGYYEHARKMYASQLRDTDGEMTEVLLKNCMQRGKE